MLFMSFDKSWQVLKQIMMNQWICDTQHQPSDIWKLYILESQFIDEFLHNNGCRFPVASRMSASQHSFSGQLVERNVEIIPRNKQYVFDVFEMMS